MGGGGGPTLEASLSRGQSSLAGTTATTETKSVAFFGFGDSPNDTYDTFNENNTLGRETQIYEGVQRLYVSATNITCPSGTDSYALFGGGMAGFSATNDVDIFKCNDDGVVDNTVNFLTPGRYVLAATSMTYDNESYALFGGGSYYDATVGTTVYSDDVNIFKCNDNGIFNDTPHRVFTTQGRNNLAATSVTSENASYALFGGGLNSPSGANFSVTANQANDRANVLAAFIGNVAGITTVSLPGGGFFTTTTAAAADAAVNNARYSNDVDIIKCNDGGFFNETENLVGPGRRNLAATSVSNATETYALFGGGAADQGGDPPLAYYSNDVDIFKCNDLGVSHYKLLNFFGPGRSNPAATSVTDGNESYALFGGGSYSIGAGTEFYSNDVDIFICNDTGVFYHKTIQFNGPPRQNLAATTVKVDGKEYALFAGGQDASNKYDTIDIYDSETQEFLPL